MIKEDVKLFLIATIINFFSESAEFRGPHHPHRHYIPQKDGVKLTQDKNLLHDAEHIQEDLGDWVTKGSARKLTPEELEFHYFIVHDFDNNTKLDGLEILKAISHTLDHGEEESDRGGRHHADDSHTATEEPLTDEEKRLTEHYQGVLVELIDQVLLEDDTDKDGFLSYPEFVIGRQREKKNKPQQQH
ncbi:unnamed protein product [Bemisia tabaci]|uniref:Multiple coagulation factor deficiency protein 2 n=1 Tax=Bemisia tabaci TaxID=7038 RepID=A0A9P0G1W0_BEMTA|nr:PREDICTED: multiple coagulation factor deficiency protein 2-like [Bemisia tabaci]CAH0769010.1 unnamed protein product [Bemisia tabaci]